MAVTKEPKVPVEENKEVQIENELTEASKSFRIPNTDSIIKEGQSYKIILEDEEK